jgi:dihydroorotase
MKDLSIVGGRVLDPTQGIDAPMDVAISDRRVVALGETHAAASTVDARGLVLTPGFVDMHTHLYEHVSHYGVDADTYCLARGVTTAVDAGSSGAQTFPGLRRFIADRAETRILAFLHVAVQGMIANLVGELEDLGWAAPDRVVRTAREHPDVVVGVKVRLSLQTVGSDPEPALRLARQAADVLALPLMVHISDMKRPITWLLQYLGAGDIVTHCFHGNDGGILTSNGRVYPEVIRSRARGVLFDVGHGSTSFTYRVARIALAQGFPPDTISSDLHSHNVAGPVYDQATTLSKLMHLGLDLADVIRATTTTPASAINRNDMLGSLAPGREADMTAFELRSGYWPLVDSEGTIEVAERLLVPRYVVRAGTVHTLASPVADLLSASDHRQRS